MKTVKNERVIKRNTQIGKIAMFGSLAVLAGGMVIAFRYQTQVTISMITLIVGFIAAQVGIYYSNRFGRSPRPDEKLDQALKGLDFKYVMYHYSGPVPHMLLGPSGIWALIPFYQRGTITYEKGRWRQRGGGILYEYLKIFAQESLGRPELEAAAQVDNILAYLKKKLPEGMFPAESPLPVQAALIFTDGRATLNIPDDSGAPYPTTTLKGIKSVVKKMEKGKGIPVEKIKLIEEALAVD